MKLLLGILSTFFATLALAANNHVPQAVVTTGLDANAKPTEIITSVDRNVGTVFFYTELSGLSGQTVAHRWIHNGKTVATVNIAVRSNYTRTFSRSSINPNHIGRWEVQVVRSNGQVLASRIFTVMQSTKRSVQARVQQQYSASCLERLTQLQKQLQENPDSPYAKFLVQQQQSRCNQQRDRQQQLQQQR